MVTKQSQCGIGATATAVVVMLLSLASSWVLAEDSWTAAELLDPEQSVLSPAEYAPFPLARLGVNRGLSFDLGGSDQQKLQLRLSEPLAIGTVLDHRNDAMGHSSTTLGGSLGWLANEDLGLSVSASQSSVVNNYQALGSIHCEDGVLARDSFTASNCFFIDQPRVPALNTVSLGAGYTPTEHSKASFSLFRENTSANNMVQDFTSQSLMPGQFPGALSSPLLQQFSGQSLDEFESQITGIDLEFQLGVSTNRAGDISLGLQLTRILDADINGRYSNGAGIQDWELDGPADSARVSFDWQKGSFSGGVESYYRAPIEFMNRGDLDSMTTFDVHFTWRTPWNANLSVGASNLLNSGTDDSPASETSLADPFESVYGRIPYVRYEQDL